MKDEEGKETRSGLWSEYKRLIKEIKPRFVIIENVRNLLNIGFAEVIKDLCDLGYNAEWEVISARSVGAKHLRERVWIVAYANLSGLWPTFATEEEKSEWWAKTSIGIRGKWEVEPSVCRILNGLSPRMERHRRERVKALGNSIVPQIAYLIGKQIIERFNV